MKLSIIIPVYNLEQYIPKCLDSIVSQSFKDYEIICINDGSTDNSLEVLNRYKDKIIIIDKENEGSGVARNVGIDRAKGEYILFVDGDDWLEENVLEKMVSKIDELTADILFFGGLSYYQSASPSHSEKELYKGRNGGYSKNKFPKKYLNRVFSSKDIKKDIFKFPSTPWSKLYRRDFLLRNNIRFQNIKVGQDQLPFFHSMITANRIAILPENLYCYRKNRKGSAMTVKKKKNFSPIYVFYGIEGLLTKLDKLEEYKYIFANRYFSKATSWLGKFQDNLKDEYFEEYIKLLSHLKNNYPKGWWTKFNPQKNDGYWILKIKQLTAKI
ncbi:glycosyltransferase [bacterium]|nr:glycosyltransferase [bacterium]